MSLLIRDLDDAVYDELCARAERHGRSVEEEAHAILANALGDGVPSLRTKPASQEPEEETE